MLCLGVLVGIGTNTTAQAAQATGDDVQPWSNGWSWTYATSFRYQADGTDATINENVTYTVAGIETFQGHPAYKMNISGTITSGSGSVAVDGVGNATLSNFAGSVSGTRYVRVSDRALLQEKQAQALTAKASVSIINQNITADLTLELNPSPSWKTHNFPLNAGDSWKHAEVIAYTGGFNYEAGSLASGSSPFEGDLPFTANATVSNESVTTPIGTTAAKKIHAQTADGTMSDTIWYSPNHKNDARQVLVLPLDGAKLTLTRNLSNASTANPAVSTTAVATPSLTCAGNTITVAGRLSNFAANVPVTVVLDQSQITPGQKVQATTSSVAGGDWSTTLQVPAQSDGLTKNGSRANWGVNVTAGTARGNTTVVVTPQNCTSVSYTGATSAEHSSNASVSAKLTDLTGASAAGRQITFTLSGGGSVTATTGSNGVATALLPVNLPARNATVTAAFAGTTGLVAASGTSPFVVEKIGSTTTVVPSESPATLGEDLTFTAHVNGAGATQPTGSVQFVVDGADFGAPLPLSGGQATSAAISTLPLGDHTVTAVYLGSAEHNGSDSGPVDFRVRMPLVNTTTTSTATPASVHFGQQVVLGATVTKTSGTDQITGDVTFTSNGIVLGTAAVDANGEASLAVDDLGAGTHAVVATYSGDDAHRASSAAPRTVTVAKAQVTVDLAASATDTVAGEAVHYTASVGVVAPAAGVATGTVQLRVNGTNLGAPVALDGGTAVFPAVDTLGAGSHAVSVVYAGTSNFEGGQDQVQQVVSRADTTTTVLVNPSPSAEGQNVTVTADVVAVAPGSGAATGLVSFFSNGDLIGANALEPTGSGARATIQLADLEPGANQVVAVFNSDANYAASESDEVEHTVIPAVAIVPTSTAVTSSTNPSIHGDLISFTATVVAEDDSMPTGMVQFSVDGIDIGGQVVLDEEGVAHSTTISSPAPGDHTVIAAFVPDAGYGGSGDIVTQTVAAAGVALTLSSTDDTSDHGQSVRFTATVASQQLGTGAPTGFVQFNVDGQPVGGAVEIVDGEAQSAAVSTLLPGTHQVTAVYSGDTNFAPTLASLTQTVAKMSTTTTLTTSASSTTYGGQVTLTAKVTPAAGGLGSPSGSVSFVRGATTLATVPVAAGGGNTATASFSTSDLAAGTHGIKAVYSGADAFAGSTSGQVSITVAKRATNLTADAAVVKLLPLGLPLGSLRVTLRSGATPLSGLPLQFKIGNATVCTLTTNASGVAICNAAAHLVPLILNGGYKVAFAGDANHTASNANGVLLK